MCLLQCRVCGASEFEGPCEKCDHVKELFDKKEKEIFDLNQKLYRIHDAVLFILKELVGQDGEDVHVTRKRILELWDAAMLQHRDNETPEQFIVDQLLEGRIHCDAAHLFSTKTYVINSQTQLGKLENIYNAIEDYRKFRGWKERCELTPKQVMKKIAKEYNS